MQLVKLTTPKKINRLQHKSTALIVAFLTAASCTVSMAQDNSPYSRYGIGDLVPPTNINSRGMGGISAGYTDYFTINFNNPASYSSFQASKEAKSKKLVNGRAILDVGMNFESRTLQEPTNPIKFKASNALFSHVAVGVPLRKNWGLSFGLRPISRISYKIGKTERLYDPMTGLPIDSAYTEYTGDGGAFLPSVGTGFKVFSKTKDNIETSFLSFGLNAGYLFGRKDISTRRTLINDTVAYYQGNFETRTNYGNLYFGAGMQYRTVLNFSKKTFLTIGAFGNWQQKLKGRQDIIRETYYFNETLGNLQLDSVSIRNDIKGDVIIPSTVTVGVVFEKYPEPKKAGWLVGVDFSQSKWENYRFYGQPDQLRNAWQLRLGAELQPVQNRNYFSKIGYRAGFFTGPDYVQAQQKDLSQYGISFGMRLPFAINRQAPYQYTFMNLGFEYIKRGNNDNLLRENMFRFSLGFSISDIWFIKRKYD